MGFFDQIKQLFGMVKAAPEMVNQAEGMGAHYQQQAQAGLGEIDLSQPQWESIEGVTLDKYAEISGRLQKEAVAGVEEVNAFAEKHGVPAGKWQPIQIGWTKRMGQHMDVRNRFGHIMSQYIT
jgi:hypothetical protein